MIKFPAKIEYKSNKPTYHLAIGPANCVVVYWKNYNNIIKKTFNFQRQPLPEKTSYNFIPENPVEHLGQLIGAEKRGGDVSPAFHRKEQLQVSFNLIIIQQMTL